MYDESRTCEECGVFKGPSSYAYWYYKRTCDSCVLKSFSGVPDDFEAQRNALLKAGDRKHKESERKRRQRLQEARLAKGQCPACGKKKRTGNSQCHKCGYQLRHDVPTSDPETPNGASSSTTNQREGTP